MAPVDFVTPTRTLHVAFSDGLDYNVLYGLERMLGCRTEPCLAVPSLLQRYLQNLPERREQTEVVFNCLGDIAELVRIVRSYIGRLDPAEVRIVRCGSHLWVRLLRGCLPMLDLVLKSFWESAPSARPETAV